MSTNIYLVRKANKVAAEKMTRYQKRGETSKLEQICKEITKGIHIGKHMCGWKFLCDYNRGLYYEKSSDSLLGFLKKTLMSGNWMINTDNCISFSEGGEEAYEFVRSMIEDSKTERNSNKYAYAYCADVSSYTIVDGIEFKDSKYDWF